MIIINCKNYTEITPFSLNRLVKISTRISQKRSVKIVIAPPTHLLNISTQSSIPIFAQHVDDANPGSTTGFIVPELLKRSRVAGSIINHSERRIPSKAISNIVERLHKLHMTTVLCVRNIAETRRYSKIAPNYIAIEPPELIGSGRAVSTEKPELISKSADIVKQNASTKMLCGAGIISGDDVAKAIELGSSGVLVASGIIKAKSWAKIIDEFASAIQQS